MTRAMAFAAAVLLVASSLAGAASAAEAPKPRIQIAILLDTSGSMEGLINQARTQLWRIVNELATTKKDGQTPALEVALFHYGNNGLPAQENYIQMLLPLTDDLDSVSEKLFALTTDGGSEYCGAVIKAAVERLKWSASPDDLKAIFIAGNEPFTQGPVDYREACKAAAAKGITVSTIHCGNEAQGIAGKWKDGADLADGSFMNIEQDRAIAQVAAPQDTRIAELGAALNTTYVAYGPAGLEGAARQRDQDANAAKTAPEAMVQRSISKAQAQYTNAAWDLVDALKEGKVRLEDLKDEDLPEATRKMSPEERSAYLAEQAKKRAELQEELRALQAERQKHVEAELKRLATEGGNTFDRAVVESLHKQAAAKGFTTE